MQPLVKGDSQYTLNSAIVPRATDLHIELVKRARTNDRSAQFDLYRMYSRAMYNTAFRITGNTASAEDVLQESFLSAFQSLDGYRADASFGHWLKTIVINKSISTLRKESRLSLIENTSELERADDPYPDDQTYEVERIRLAMARLPDGFRTVLSLYLLEGYDHQEIGEILGVTESTSKSQYKRAKDRLKLLLESEVTYG